MPVVSLLKHGIYQDSVRLMRLSEHLSGLEQVNQAFVAMGTDANKRVLAEAGLLTEPVRGAGANDLVVVVDAASKDAANRALVEAERLLAGTDRPSVANGVARAAPRTSSRPGATYLMRT